MTDLPHLLCPLPVAAVLLAALATYGAAATASPSGSGTDPGSASAAVGPGAVPGTRSQTLPWSPQLAEAITRTAQQAVDALGLAAGEAPRLEVRVGAWDSRLKLAPCTELRPFWPAGQRLLGHARVGLRCHGGPVRWQVYLPVTIRLWGQAWVVNSDLPAGTVLAPEHLQRGEADLLARPDEVLTDENLALGRPLARPLAKDQAVRRDDLRLRQWVRPGETVRLLAGGRGFQVMTEAQALAAAHEGQPVKVRTDTGRVVQGVATGERQVTVPL